jgi:hypothetical protein
MELLGSSLSQLFKINGSRFSLGTVLKLADQIVSTFFNKSYKASSDRADAQCGLRPQRHQTEQLRDGLWCGYHPSLEPALRARLRSLEALFQEWGALPAAATRAVTHGDRQICLDKLSFGPE